jgi:hypothetical protein
MKRPGKAVVPHLRTREIQGLDRAADVFSADNKGSVLRHVGASPPLPSLFHAPFTCLFIQ